MSQFPQRGKAEPTVVEQMLAVLTKRSIPVREKYISARASHREQYAVTVEDYFTHEAWMKERRLVCPEHYAAELSNLIDASALPDWCDKGGRLSMHLGYAESVTPLHFDWDFANVLHVCLEGRRRVWLAPPQQERLFPATSNSALIDFELPGPERRETMLRSIGCSSHDLEPGEFIRFPSFWWHLVEYFEASLAISARTEINPILRPLTMLPRSPELQRLAASLATAPTPDQIAIISKLIAGFHRSFSEGSEAVNQCYAQLGLAPMEADPWIIPLRSLNERSPDRGTPTSDQVRLCRDWLFGLWPTPLPLPDQDANALASRMASSISRPH